MRLCPWSLSIPVLGLESVCPRKGCPWPWPRIFFCVLGLEPCVLDSTSVICTSAFKQKNAIVAPNPNLNSNCNPSSNFNFNPSQNSKSKPQITTNNNNLKNRRANEHPFWLSYSLQAELICTLNCKSTLPLKKLTSINPNRLYFITLDKDIIWEEGLMKRHLRELIGN